MTFTEELISSQQGRLADLGYYAGRIDGIPAAATQNAMSRFKAAHGMRDRPYPGPLTMAALWSSAAKPAPIPQPLGHDPAWLTEARSLLGTREVPGAANNPTIMSWAQDLDQWYPGDDTAWCGLFMAHIMSVGAPHEPQPFNRLGARNWMEYGVDALNGQDPLTADLPLGGGAVFWRTHPIRSWHGHVATITGQSETGVRVIGGNQSDNVTETWFDRDRLLGVRGPSGHVFVSAPRAATGRLSERED